VGLTILAYLSLWYDNGKLIGWKRISPPNHLSHLVSKILGLLVECVPLDSHLLDAHCWGDANYSVKRGFQQLLVKSVGPPFSNICPLIC
jgi:hypothetical protein